MSTQSSPSPPYLQHNSNAQHLLLSLHRLLTKTLKCDAALVNAVWLVGVSAIVIISWLCCFPATMAGYFLVDSQELLTKLIDKCYKHRVIGVDCEGTSSWYHPDTVSLIQINVNDKIYIVDVLSLREKGIDLTGLKNILEDDNVLKVFHDVVSDKLFLRHIDVNLRNVFDTKVAAEYLCFESIGYGDVVYKVLGIRLEKGYQQYDFAYRPLHNNALRYAADDVRYLIKLYVKLKSLAEKLDVDQEVKFDSDCAAVLRVTTRVKMPNLLRNERDGGKIRHLYILYLWRDALCWYAHYPPGTYVMMMMSIVEYFIM